MENKLIINRIVGAALIIYLIWVAVTCHQTGSDFRPYIDDILRAFIVFMVIKGLYKKLIK